MSKNSNLKFNSPVVYVSAIAVVLLLAVLSYMYIAPKLTGNQGKQPASQAESHQSRDAYASIPQSAIQLIESDASVTWNVNDPYYFYNESPVVALVHIDSIDGGRNYSPIFEQYVSPQTIGKMTIKEVYKGGVTSGQQLSYARLGGTVTYDEYLKGLSTPEKDKINYLSKGRKPAEEYVKTKFHDDIDIEVGKDYIVFLRPLTSKDGTYQEYTMDGMQYGLREARGAGDQMKVLNNTTKEWESPSSVLRQR